VTEQSWSGPAVRHGGVLWDAIRDLLGSAEAAAPGDVLRVLDLGGGTGGLAVPIAELGHEVTVVDPSPDALAALDRRASEAGVETALRGVQGDAADLLEHVDPGAFHVVLCHGVLEVVDEPAEALAAVEATMRPDGILSVVVAGRYAAVLAKAMAGHLSEARSLLDPSVTLPTAQRPRRYAVDEIVGLLVTHGLEPERVHAVRTFADLIPSATFDIEPDAAGALQELERAVTDVDAFAAVAAQLHVVARRRERVSGSG
jgi:S-adenosylmethionine-dependent methyltransferase